MLPPPPLLTILFFLLAVAFFFREDRKLDMRNWFLLEPVVDTMSPTDALSFLRDALGLIRRKSAALVRLGLLTIFTVRFVFFF